MRGVVLQARMSGTTYDRSLAFQAAEAALREAERRAATATAADVPATGCNAGYCATPALTATPRWTDEAFTGWRTAVAAAPTEAPTPEAIAESMGSGPNWYGCEFEIPRQPIAAPSATASARAAQPTAAPLSYCKASTRRPDPPSGPPNQRPCPQEPQDHDTPPPTSPRPGAH
jgi:type IV pilus assembly protein PilX